MQHDLISTEANSDLDVIAGLISGAPNAWRELHARYGRLIFRCIRRVTGAFGGMLSIDDEQEIYANLALALLSNDKRRLRAFDPGKSRLGTWLGLLATHAAYDYLRERRREVPCAPLSEADGAHADDRWLREVEGKEQSALVRELVAGLSEKDQQFVRLYFGSGLAPDAVAAAMNISVKTVYSKKHKIRSRLENMMAA